MASKSTAKNPLTLVQKLPLVAIALAAGAIAVMTATSGINHDQMIFYRAALRLISGQIPYRDFTVPQGPIAGLVLAPFLLAAPTGGYGFVAASAVLNAVASLLLWGLVRRATGDRWAALAAAAITAVWYLPIFGSYYNDHLAYVLILAGLALYLGAADRGPRLVGAGILFALSFHTKQTVGLFGLVALAITCAAASGVGVLWSRRARYFLSGYLATHLLVWLSIAAVGGFPQYFFSVVQCPLRFAARSPGKSPWRLVQFLVMPWAIDPVRMIAQVGCGRIGFYPVCLAAYAGLYYCWRAWRPRPWPQSDFLIAFLLLSTLWCSAWLGRFHGQLFFGMGGVVILLARALAPERARPLAISGVGAFFIALGAAHVYFSAPRLPSRDARYDTTDLYPIRLERSRLTATNYEVANYLRDRPGSFAVGGGDTYYVAAAIRRAPLNPSVYFEYPLTVPADDTLRAQWQDRFIDVLGSHRVRYLVADTTWVDKERVPRLKRYVIDHYRVVYVSWPLEVLERVTGLVDERLR